MGSYDDNDEETVGLGNVEAAIEAVERLADIDRVTEADVSIAPGLLIAPKGKQVVDLRPFQEARLERPRRIHGHARHTTLDSFIDHAVRFKDAGSAIYANDDIRKPSLLAVLDYHERAGAPRFGTHRSVYDFPFSDPWVAWATLAAKGWIAQADLAAFLEERIVDVILPEDGLLSTREKVKKAGIEMGAPSSIAGLARNLNVTVNAEISSATTLATGEGQLLFKETHQTSVKVPGGLLLAVPVFRGGLAEDVVVRLRYRVTEGKVRFAVLLHDVDALFRNAFNESCARVVEKTALPVFFGSPE